jgi:hypothetical protein
MSDTIILDSKKCNAQLLTIHADGRITVAEHLKPTETAAAVLQIMREQWMDDIQSKKIREQEDRIKRLEEVLDKTSKAACKHIKQLESEVYALRLYGNKDCTAMADQALKEAKL